MAVEGGLAVPAGKSGVGLDWQPEYPRPLCGEDLRRIIAEQEDARVGGEGEGARWGASIGSCVNGNLKYLGLNITLKQYSRTTKYFKS